MNGGASRSALPSSAAPQDKTLRGPAPGHQAGPPYDVVKGDIDSVLPFGNTVTTRTVTGTQLYAVLENSVSVLPCSSGRFLRISGFSYTYDVSKPQARRLARGQRQARQRGGHGQGQRHLHPVPAGAATGTSCWPTSRASPANPTSWCY
ncbi:hypothetical protein GCM10008949_48430 [Deinococcus humi]|nr:hypothetical protein GCM10008949_48430 [Deinococcus humi]